MYLYRYARMYKSYTIEKSLTDLITEGQVGYEEKSENAYHTRFQLASIIIK